MYVYTNCQLPATVECMLSVINIHTLIMCYTHHCFTVQLSILSSSSYVTAPIYSATFCMCLQGVHLTEFHAFYRTGDTLL